jgi:hypothetical protein
MNFKHFYHRLEVEVLVVKVLVVEVFGNASKLDILSKEIDSRQKMTRK